MGIDFRISAKITQEIALRKKEVQQLWQQSIVGLAKRNDALSAMQQAVREQQQEIFAKQRELEGVQRNIKASQERNEVCVCVNVDHIVIKIIYKLT